ncbi:MAG: hypothetical protein U1E35_04320 [Rhodospirillales bacterium]
MTIFDRSWYGRVLVERIEGFAQEAEWKRAYAEINDFEDQLVRHGIVLCKFWFHISKDEQLARFKAREGTPYKRWKLTDEDWRNREKWDQYEAAVDDMIEHTSSMLAPWTLVEANDKRYARVKVLKTVYEQLQGGISCAEAAGKPKKVKLEKTAAVDEPGRSRPMTADDEGLQAFVAVATEITDDEQPPAGEENPAALAATAPSAPALALSGKSASALRSGPVPEPRVNVVAVQFPGAQRGSRPA